MRRWTGLVLLAGVIWAGAFGASLLAVEWRQESTDLDPLADEIAALRTEVAELKLSDNSAPPDKPTPTPTPTLEPEPIVVTAEADLVVESRGMRLTVESYTPYRNQGTIKFGLENVDAPPEQAHPSTFAYKAVDYGGFLCTVDTFANHLPADSVPRLEQGEKLIFTVGWVCHHSPPKTLFIDNIHFFLPAAPRP